MMKSIKEIFLTNQRVFLRADLNVPLKNKTIMQDYRLQAILPTIDYIQKNGGKVILATHIGRPPALSKKNFFDENLSTRILIPWFEQHGYTIDYEIDLIKAIKKSNQHPDQILLLENLRFFNGEQQTNNEFAQLLAQCGDVYVNDAFGVSHRQDTSVTLLPEQFDDDHRSLGLLFEKELKTLMTLKQKPLQPFVVVLGGSKAATKITGLDKLLDAPIASRPNSILIGGAIANTFLQAQNFNVGKSNVEENLVHVARNFLKKAEQSNVKALLPIDVCIAPPQSDKPPTPCNISSIPSDQMIVDIGPQTIKLFTKEINRAKTIFSNGTMGIYENKNYETGSREILKAIANADTNSIIGGGDTVAATFQFNLKNKMNFLSTGGSATLNFLAQPTHNK